MPEIVEKAEQGAGKFKEMLTKKVGPLPVWAWSAIGIGGLLLLKGRSSAATAGTATGTGALPSAFDQPPNPFDTMPGVLGGPGTTGGGPEAILPFGPTSGAGATTDPGTIDRLPPIFSGGNNGDASSGQTAQGKSSVFVNVPFVGSVKVPWFDLTAPGQIATPNTPSVTVPWDFGGKTLQPGQMRILPVSYEAPVNPQSLVDASKTLGTGPLAIIPNTAYVGVVGSKDTVHNIQQDVNGFASIPGAPGLTQGETVADLRANSQAIIADSPALQQEIATANVTATQRENAIVGPGGILLY